MNKSLIRLKLKHGVFLSIFTLTVLLIYMTACSKTQKVNEDVLTMKSTQQERTQISVLVKNAFTINGFEQAVEEKFPEIDLIQVGNFASDMGITEYAARLEHNDLTDIVMTWPLDVGKEYWEERLIDLSGMEFTSRYNLSMLNEITTDGKLYYLPGPAQVRGIVYNQTLFEENGWKVPKNYEEFIALCKTIEETGIRSIQLGFGNAEVLDTAFTGFNYGNYFSKPHDIQWMEDYNQGRGSFGEHFSDALQVFQDMIDTGIWKASDLKVTYSDREMMFFNRQCAMVEDSVLMARLGEERTGIKDTFALMPFFNPGENNDWARLYMVCYIGLNKQLTEAENKEKYDLVLKLMEYISTPEGQKALASDTGAMLSSLNNTEPPDIPEIYDLLSALSHGRYATFPTLKNAQNALRKGLAGMLEGTLTKEDVIKMVDIQNKAPIQAQEPETLAKASDNFSLAETGAYVTDVLREYSGCEIALFLDDGKDGNSNGKGIVGKIYKGEVTTDDVKRILPDLKTEDKGTLWKVSMRGEDLIKTLEYAIPVMNQQVGWFYYCAGLNIVFNPQAIPGERILDITTTDGKKIEKEQIYTVAVSETSVPEEYLLSCEKTGVPITEILTKALRDAKTISPAKDNRFVIEIK